MPRIGIPLVIAIVAIAAGCSDGADGTTSPAANQAAASASPTPTLNTERKIPALCFDLRGRDVRISGKPIPVEDGETLIAFWRTSGDGSKWHVSVQDFEAVVVSFILDDYLRNDWTLILGQVERHDRYELEPSGDGRISVVAAIYPEETVLARRGDWKGTGLSDVPPGFTAIGTEVAIDLNTLEREAC